MIFFAQYGSQRETIKPINIAALIFNGNTIPIIETKCTKNIIKFSIETAAIASQVLREAKGGEKVIPPSPPVWLGIDAQEGAVHVKLDNSRLNISSPGGFIEGVNLRNQLVAPPHSRNPLLADIIKRIGLAERTGRGIDRIYEGMLRYGRPAPDYSTSNAYTVSVFMANAAADRDFLKMVVEQHDRLGDPIIEPLIILTRLRDERRLTTSDIAPVLQKSEPQTRIIIERLLEAGMIEAHGTGRGRSYTLSAGVYEQSGQKAAYIRQVGFAPIQQEQMVLNYIDKHASIKRAEIMDLCHLDRNQAYRLLTRMKEAGQIKQIGEQKGAVYVMSGLEAICSYLCSPSVNILTEHKIRAPRK